MAGWPSLWFDRGVIAGRGVAIGASFAALKRAYRTLEIRRDAYVPGARNVYVRRTRAPHWRLRFDVSPQGRVTRIAFGDLLGLPQRGLRLTRQPRRR